MKITNKHKAPIVIPANVTYHDKPAPAAKTEHHAAVEIAPGQSVDIDDAHYEAVKNSAGMKGLLKAGMLDDGHDHSDKMSAEEKSRHDASAVVKNGPAPQDQPGEPLPPAQGHAAHMDADAAKRKR